MRERTNKIVKEVEELWEGSHAPQASMLHSVYGEGGDYVARQEKKIDKLRNQLEDLNAMKEVLKMEEERGYKGRDMEILERMMKFKTALD
ncbi:hypothetical protein [Priestia endophytica]|uniref:hypothetical protein n=1 Tax=Priestia endophytica TaxID=135735 RepID=UPI00227F2268|nr:hypothetical protein [Priestia endophytica]MCY8233997.1 hypothetical protein [Priestia endophytica]